LTDDHVVIETEALWHIYPGNVEALRGVDLKIDAGKIIAVIGQNGSGKTTLVKHFNGLLKPTKGRVLIKEKAVTEYKQREIVQITGYVFQNPTHQLFCDTVEKEIAFGPKNIKLSDSEVKERVEEAIEMFGLAEYRDRHPLRLSLPLRKILTMASVYAIRPEVLILDEPTTAQDYVTVKLIKKIIQELNAEGHTIIVVTHDMPLVAETADKVLVMFDGEIISEGPPKRIFIDDHIMEKTNLMPPQITQLAQTYNGKKIPKDVLTVEEMFSILNRIGN